MYISCVTECINDCVLTFPAITKGNNRQHAVGVEWSPKILFNIIMHINRCP